MASTALKSDEEKKEYFDSPEELDAKITQLADWVRSSSHFIAFTGAGVSTSAGIPDFRSGYNTVLPTGPGAWEVKAKGEPVKAKIRTEMRKAIPTPTHMSLLKLMEVDRLKFLISQNTDGLHRRSGIDPHKLAEVHGNTNLEKCIKCKKEYMRDFRVRNAQKVHDHETGRLCEDEGCRGKLHDSIINFGENLDEKVLEDGFNHSAMADLCLAMGSSLTVTPAADMPRTTSKKGGRLVVVNLQKTPLDNRAALKIHAFCDTVMQMLMQKLDLEIPSFRLTRRMRVKKTVETKNNTAQDCLEFMGIDSDGCPFTLFTSVVVKKGKVERELKTQLKYKESSITGKYKVKLNWQGHYSEPPLEIELDTTGLDILVYVMIYDPFRKVWESVTTL